jgi:hypothetical protein
VVVFGATAVVVCMADLKARCSKRPRSSDVGCSEHANTLNTKANRVAVEPHPPLVVAGATEDLGSLHTCDWTTVNVQGNEGGVHVRDGACEHESDFLCLCQML